MQHKEAIKKLKTDVDVLTLTATPIPRTLEMSLTGIRDLTLLNTPPADRQPILTYVGEYDERAVAEAIRRELLREGQVFFVHNRVQDIDDGGRRAARARARGPHRHRPRPDGRGHARAGRGRLLGGRVRRARVHHDHRVGHRHADGEHARGRPRRPARPRPAPPAAGPGRAAAASGPTPTCSTRATRSSPRRPTSGCARSARPPSWAAGFKIAMRDLEIRGAGNLLGEDQSGHIAAVGYDLYCQMVTEAVAEMKGEAVREPAEVKLDVPVDAHLPAGLRGQGGAAARGLPAAGRGHHHGRGRRHPRRVGGPLRAVPEPAERAARRSAGCGPSATASASATCRSPATRPASPRSGCGPARRCACGGWPRGRSTRRTPASSSCRCPGATTRPPVLVGVPAGAGARAGNCRRGVKRAFAGGRRARAGPLVIGVPRASLRRRPPTRRTVNGSRPSQQSGVRGRAAALLRRQRGRRSSQQQPADPGRRQAAPSPMRLHRQTRCAARSLLEVVRQEASGVASTVTPGDPAAGRAAGPAVHASIQDPAAHDRRERLPRALPGPVGRRRPPPYLALKHGARRRPARRRRAPEAIYDATPAVRRDLRPPHPAWPPRTRPRTSRPSCDAGRRLRADVAKDRSDTSSAATGGEIAVTPTAPARRGQHVRRRLRRGGASAATPGKVDRARADPVRLAPDPRRQASPRCPSTRSKDCRCSRARRGRKRGTSAHHQGPDRRGEGADIAVNPRYGTWDADERTGSCPPGTATRTPATTATTGTTGAAATTAAG